MQDLLLHCFVVKMHKSHPEGSKYCSRISMWVSASSQKCKWPFPKHWSSSFPITDPCFWAFLLITVLADLFLFSLDHRPSTFFQNHICDADRMFSQRGWRHLWTRVVFLNTAPCLSTEERFSNEIAWLLIAVPFYSSDSRGYWLSRWNSLLLMALYTSEERNMNTPSSLRGTLLLKHLNWGSFVPFFFSKTFCEYWSI